MHQFPPSFSVHQLAPPTAPASAFLHPSARNRYGAMFRSQVETQTTRPPALLRLPPHIRHWIYVHVGVVRLDRRPNTHCLDGSEPMAWLPNYDEFPEPPAFKGLLRTCRALYAEAAPLLYSANRFVVYYHKENALAPLRALSPTALSSLTNLKVILHENSCHLPINPLTYPPRCCLEQLGVGRGRQTSSCGRFHPRRHGHHPLHPDPDDPSVRCWNPQGGWDAERDQKPDAATQMAMKMAMLTEWHATVAHMSPYIAPGRLDLALVCDLDPEKDTGDRDTKKDVSDDGLLATARLAVSPLALFPQLKDCHVPLCKKRNRRLQALAQEAALRARFGTPPPPRHASARPPSPPLTLMGLPIELRHRILEYTDLITPWRTARWDDRRCWSAVERWDLSEEDHEHALRLATCDATDEDCDDPERRHPGCFCRHQHAAFSSVCRCWEPPTDLFAVPREFCRAAKFLFFSGIRFVISDFGPRPPTPAFLAPRRRPLGWDPLAPAVLVWERDDRLAISQFLRKAVPAHSLGDLRHIDLDLPGYEPERWPDDNGHYLLRELAAVVDAGMSWIRAPALAVRIVVNDDGYRDGLQWILSHGVVHWDGDALHRILWPLDPMLREGLERCVPCVVVKQRRPRRQRRAQPDDLLDF